jgi:hypothetical protein
MKIFRSKSPIFAILMATLSIHGPAMPSEQKAAAANQAQAKVTISEA